MRTYFDTEIVHRDAKTAPYRYDSGENDNSQKSRLGFDLKGARNPKEADTAYDGGNSGDQAKDGNLLGREADDLALDDTGHLVYGRHCIGEHEIREDVQEKILEFADFSTMSGRLVS